VATQLWWPSWHAPTPAFDAGPVKHSRGAVPGVHVHPLMSRAEPQEPLLASPNSEPPSCASLASTRVDESTSLVPGAPASGALGSALGSVDDAQPDRPTAAQVVPTH